MTLGKEDSKRQTRKQAPTTHTNTGNTEKKCCCGKNLSMETDSVLSLSTIMQYFPSLMCLINPGPISPPPPQGVSFESFSSISRTRLYSNAIRQGIKATSIICIEHLFPFKDLKDCNIKQTIDITMLLFMKEHTPSFYYCTEKLLRQLGEENIHLYFALAAALCNGWVQIIGWMAPR